jgi:tRNA modification GTPase
VCLSAVTGEGLQALREELLRRAGGLPGGEGVFTARSRHLHALARTQHHLLRAAEQLALELPALELLAEELRLGHDALAQITGAFTSDDLLGEIFSRFCIGK